MGKSNETHSEKKNHVNISSLNKWLVNVVPFSFVTNLLLVKKEYVTFCSERRFNIHNSTSNDMPNNHH